MISSYCIGDIIEVIKNSELNQNDIASPCGGFGLWILYFKDLWETLKQ